MASAEIIIFISTPEEVSQLKRTQFYASSDQRTRIVLMHHLRKAVQLNQNAPLKNPLKSPHSYARIYDLELLIRNAELLQKLEINAVDDVVNSDG